MVLIAYDSVEKLLRMSFFLQCNLRAHSLNVIMLYDGLGSMHGELNKIEMTK